MVTRRRDVRAFLGLIGAAAVVAACHAPRDPASQAAPTANAPATDASSVAPASTRPATKPRTVNARTAQTVTAAEGRPVALALGDTASFGPWRVTWTEVREGLVRLAATYRDEPADAWSASDDARMATHDAQTRDALFTFEVRVIALTGSLEGPDGRVEIAGRAVDRAPSANFGQSLKPGVYVMPDGMRVHLEQLYGCDFDPSVPCPFGGTYRVDAAVGEKTVHVELRARETRVLGRTLELGRDRFVVRK